MVSPMKKTIVIDNYDSFVFNLVQYIGELGGNPEVYRNDEITVEEVRAKNPTHIVISPGPGHPSDPHYFGVSEGIIKDLGKSIPVLGVCLGHQGITTAFGGQVVKAPAIMHGKTSSIIYTSSILFEGVNNPFTAMRYHSLVAEPSSFPSCLRLTATTEDGIIMALEHTEYPIYGVQFHPESIGTPEGMKMIQNFLTL